MRIVSRDLFFRAKLRAVVHAAGATLAGETEDPDIAVIEIGTPDADATVQSWLGRGITVVVFGSHVEPEALRGFRTLGARAVPNSAVERTLAGLLQA